MRFPHGRVSYPPLQTKQARAGKKQPIRNRTFGFIKGVDKCKLADHRRSSKRQLSESLYGGQFTFINSLIEPNFYVQLPHRGGSTVSLETIPFRNRLCRHPRHNFSADTQEVLRGLTLLVV